MPPYQEKLVDVPTPDVATYPQTSSSLLKSNAQHLLDRTITQEQLDVANPLEQKAQVTPPQSTSSPLLAAGGYIPTMSYQTIFQPTPVSALTHPTLEGCNAPPQEDTDFESIYERELSRLLLAGTELRIAISTAMALTNAEQANGAHPTPNQQTHQGTNPPSIQYAGYGVSYTLHNPANQATTTTLPSHINAQQGLATSTPLSGRRITGGQYGPHWGTTPHQTQPTQPQLRTYPTMSSNNCHPTTPLNNTALDEKTKRAQQEQAMQAFGSVTIFCDRQRFGRFDDWAAHLESTFDLGNFEEARKLRLMRSKLYGEAAEEFDTFKLDNPIRSQEYAAVKAPLLKLFHSTETRSQRSVEFHNIKREPEENMRRYANRIRKAFHKAYPMDGILDSATTASREKMMMDRFLEAVEESQTRVRIHAAYTSTNAPTNQNELTSVLEALNRLSNKVDQNATTHKAELQHSLAEMKRQLAQMPSQVGGRQRDPNVTQPEAFKRAALFCEFHNTWGYHAETDCFTKLQQKNELCQLCRNIGHRHNFCPTIRNPKPPPPSGHYANTPATPADILRSQAEN
ncbi:hypothetical protein OUZ56_011701 [Daphnia magna]|uniref:Retrotransposon gag domain-containing protein n=1 Tax=Daphnia magna TaxID=35525 RepID=A0ABQ9Z0W8_9CRUS|nr:hypothetical protein OUZ56_011701 [Daphnia magna]